MCRSLDRSCVHFENVHTVDPHAWDVVRLRKAVELLLTNRPLRQRAHSIKVILANKNHGKLPQRRQVQRFMEGTLGYRAVAKKATDNLRFFLVLDREAKPRSQRQSTANDRVPTHESQLGVEQMHRTASTARHAGRLTEQL